MVGPKSAGASLGGAMWIIDPVLQLRAVVPQVVHGPADRPQAQHASSHGHNSGARTPPASLSQAGQSAGSKGTGMRSCSCAMVTFAAVVMMMQVRSA